MSIREIRPGDLGGCPSCHVCGAIMTKIARNKYECKSCGAVTIPDDRERCPYCCSTNIETPTVDIGVGEQRCGSKVCRSCGAEEIDYRDEDVSEAERKVGWYEGNVPLTSPQRVAWNQIWTELELGEHYTELRPLAENAKKVLVVCRGGNCRSVAAAFLLKYKYGIDALACSFEKNNPPTIFMLCQWADRVIVMCKDHFDRLPFAAKLRLLDVGDDTYANPLDIRLLKRIDAVIMEALL